MKQPKDTKTSRPYFHCYFRPTGRMCSIRHRNLNTVRSHLLRDSVSKTLNTIFKLGWTAIRITWDHPKGGYFRILELK